MPYFIEDDNADCAGWATVKADGEVMGCHQTKADAIDQMVALSIAEGIEPGGERSVRDLPDNYRPAVSEDVPEGRACGNCVHYDEDMVNEDGERVWCRLWEDWVRGDHYCDRWQTADRYKKDDEDEGRMMASTECVRHVEFRALPSEDGLTLEGYAAVFNSFTEINDMEGRFREQIAPGAFKRTLGMRMPVLQFDHGQHPLIGSIPLGRITAITEDKHGLRVRARLSDNWLVEPVRDAIRDRAISGMSFRFRVVDDEWSRTRDGMAERTIREVELYEVGPVVFPAYADTTVGVRSAQALKALQDPETRAEIARMLMISGTDDMSPAVTDDPASRHSSEPDSPAVRHLSIPHVSQRRAKAMIAGVLKETQS